MFIDLLCRRFIPGIDAPEKPSVRVACGIFSGYVSIAVNIFLFALKITIGILSGSIAVAADAANNLSDAGSGIVTLLGFKLAAKPADSEHPFGHGRIELCCGIVVAVIVIMMGLDFLKEGVSRIFSSSTVTMTPVLTWLLAGSLLFKLWLFFFYRHIGRIINSAAVSASAFDCLSDMTGTAVVLLALLAGKYTTIPVDGIAGVLVAVMVLIGGGKILRDTISPLLGEPPSEEFVAELKSRLLQCEGITGVHDIIIHNYGPNQYFATAHAEVVQHNDLLSVHDMLESAEVEIGKNMPVQLLLHCDPYNPADQEGKIWRVKLENITADVEPAFKLYDFRMKKSEGKTILSCHILIPRNYHLSEKDIFDKLESQIKKFSSEIELKVTFVYPYI